MSKPKPKMLPAKAALSQEAHVINIQLTAFQYDADYVLAEEADVILHVTVLHRAPPGGKRFDVVVTVTYTVEGRAEPLLSSSCLTSYGFNDLMQDIDPEDGEESVSITEELIRLMSLEAIAHARALTALHSAATPFSKSYITLGKRYLHPFDNHYEDEAEMAE